MKFPCIQGFTIPANNFLEQDGNLQDALVDKLGLNFAGESDDPDFVTKK